MVADADIAACRAAIRTGSHSFHAASRLLPRRVRDPALALYAFCRLADDAVDEVAGSERARAVARLRARLEAVYRDTPRDAPADRAFARVVHDFAMPRALPDALIEGLEWDAEGRRYDTLADVLAYSARVAAAVGAMMCVLMRVRDADALARACDLGLAMQLTNIARDVGEDARAGRIYLPRDWLHEAGIAPRAFLADPRPDPRIAAVVRRLLGQADRLYRRAEAGIGALPADCRPGIFAARHIYDGIGTAVARAGHDSISTRARTGGPRKLGWIGLSALRTGGTMLLPRPATLHARPEPEVAHLVAAAALARPEPSGTDALFEVFAQLKARDRAHAPEGLDAGGA